MLEAQFFQVRLQGFNSGALSGDFGTPVVVLGTAQSPLAIRKSGKDRLHPVVIALENGIKNAMIMAARTTNGEPKQTLAHGADYLIEFILPCRTHGFLIPADLTRQIGRSGNQKPQRCIGLDRVTGNLFEDEPVIGHIGVQGGDHPVAVMPGIGALKIRLKAHGFRPADDIQPMLCPALAVARGGQ